MSKTQKLSIRLLREGIEPANVVRAGVALFEWPRLEGALIALETLGSGTPKWARFLELSEDEKSRVSNYTALGLVFVQASGRWFAVSFGIGHVKLDFAGFEQDFGLRVVLNAVNPRQLRSADVRTPDENTLSRRMQTSRGSDQTAFAIDIERDLVRGLAGMPKDTAFGSYVAGTDGLTLNRKLDVDGLAQACAQAYAIYQKSDYKADFGWIDQIRHIRDQALIKKLDAKLVAAMAKAVDVGATEGIHLAFPVIYDPERSSRIRYKGFRSEQLYADLDLPGYLAAFKERGRAEYTDADLRNHTVSEVDGEGRDCGGKWKLRECIVFETDHDGLTYVFSGGLWYRVDRNLAKEVQEFFDNARKIKLPEAEADETESKYNERIAGLDADMICLDRQLIKPTGSSTTIEACDFLGRERRLIHIKDKTSSSRLSHLFNQGTVSARVLAIDPPSRDMVRAKVVTVQAQTGQTGYEDIVPKSDEDFTRSEFTVVYGVIVASAKPKLPFFSLVTFRQAARELKALGYNYAFAWIEKPKSQAKAPARRSVNAGEDTGEVAE